MAHRTAVGACSLAAKNRPFDMRTLVGLFVREAEEHGLDGREALVVLLNSVIGLGVYAAAEHTDAAEFFDSLAQRMAVKS